jgi:hypothetical protein
VVPFAVPTKMHSIRGHNTLKDSETHRIFLAVSWACSLCSQERCNQSGRLGPANTCSRSTFRGKRHHGAAAFMKFIVIPSTKRDLLSWVIPYLPCSVEPYDFDYSFTANPSKRNFQRCVSSLFAHITSTLKVSVSRHV